MPALPSIRTLLALCLALLANAVPARAETETVAIEQAAPSLPLPYEAWSRPAPPPPARDVGAALPPPLARAPEVGRRPLELVLASSITLPSCAPGSVGDRGCATTASGLSLAGNVLYRPTPFFATGVELVLGGFHQRGALKPLDAAFVGLAGRVYFADGGAWEPYVGLGLGLGRLRLRPSVEREREIVASSSGFAGRVTGGLDFAFSDGLRVGINAGFAHWLAFREQHCDGSVCSSGRYAQGRLSGFANLGLALTGNFGERL